MLVGVLVFLACPLTLRSAWADWKYQSPVAELALVPVLAAAMALVRRFAIRSSGPSGWGRPTSGSV